MNKLARCTRCKERKPMVGNELCFTCEFVVREDFEAHARRNRKCSFCGNAIHSGSILDVCWGCADAHNGVAVDAPLPGAMFRSVQEAQAAIAQGDWSDAVRWLDMSIAEKPNGWLTREELWDGALRAGGDDIGERAFGLARRHFYILFRAHFCKGKGRTRQHHPGVGWYGVKLDENGH